MLIQRLTHLHPYIRYLQSQTNLQWKRRSGQEGHEDPAIFHSLRKWEFHERTQRLLLRHQAGFRDHEGHGWIDAVRKRHLNRLVDRGYNLLKGWQWAYT